MIEPIKITTDEKDLLLEWKRNGVNALIRDRAHAALLNSQGFSANSIAKILYRDFEVVRKWLSNFRDSRVSSLFPKYNQNKNASKLTEVQIQEIKEALNKPPSEYGIPKKFWQVKDLALVPQSTDFLSKTQFKVIS